MIGVMTNCFYVLDIVAIEVGECLRRWCCARSSSSPPVDATIIPAGKEKKRRGQEEALTPDILHVVAAERGLTDEPGGNLPLQDQIRNRPSPLSLSPNNLSNSNSFDENWQADPAPSSSSIYRTLSMQKTMQSPYSQPQQLLAARTKRGSTNTGGVALSSPLSYSPTSGSTPRPSPFSTSVPKSPSARVENVLPPVPPPVVRAPSKSQPSEKTEPSSNNSFLSRVMTFGQPTNSATKNILRHSESVSGDYLYAALAEEVVVEGTIENVQPALRHWNSSAITPRASTAGKTLDLTPDNDTHSHHSVGGPVPIPPPVVLKGSASTEGPSAAAAAASGRSLGRPSRGSYQQPTKPTAVDEERTWVYHAVMETIHRIQQEHAATIVVMM
jgi:hypothetical protein